MPGRCSSCRGDAWPTEEELNDPYFEGEGMLCEDCRPVLCVYCDLEATAKDELGDPACELHKV